MRSSRRPSPRNSDATGEALVSRRQRLRPVDPGPVQTYGEWGDILSDQVLAAAILDRLLHHSVTISIRGESYRLNDKRKARVFHTEEVKGDPSYMGNSNLMILG